MLTDQNIQEALNELYTLQDWLRWGLSQFQAANLFYGHGTDNAWDDIVYLVLHALNLPLDINQQLLAANITTSERHKLAKLIARRIRERMPVAYLVNTAWFAGLPFYVDERVLIPRSPIAELIENQFEPWLIADNVETILDIGTGSGCIAIACAKAFPDARIDAVDISASALDVARTNAEKHQVENQVQFTTSDLFSALKDKKYNIIISNPPYVSDDEMAVLPDEYQHEPSLALASEDEGLHFALQILREASKHLLPNGILIIEVGNSEYAMRERLPEVPFTWLEFKRGGGGVFLLTAEQLIHYQHYFE